MRHFGILAVVALALAPQAFAQTFTPAISGLPDIVLGNRTPIDPFDAGLPVSSEETVEFQNGEPLPDSFRIDDAINIYDFVEDLPNGVPGYTPDESLIYHFSASGADFGGESGRDDSLEIEGTPIPPEGAVVTPDSDGTLDFEDVLAAVTDPVLGLFDYGVPTGECPPFVRVEGADVINASAVQLTVTNNQGQYASSEFMVYTVADNADAVLGDSLSGGIPICVSAIDLSTWVYSATATPGLGGAAFDFPGDTGATGAKTADDDADGSGNDLLLRITDHSTSTVNPRGHPWSPHDSLQDWRSPIGLVPFVDGSTYRLRYRVRQAAAPGVATSLVEARARWDHGTNGNLGSGNNVARPRVNRPSDNGNWYTVMFDALDVGSADNPTTGAPSLQENDITLHFEAIDFFQNYGGAIELEEVAVDQMDSTALTAAQTILFDVMDFTAETADISFRLGADISPATVATAGDLVLATPVSQGDDIGFPVWGSLDIRLANAERAVIPRSVPQPTGLIYRTEFRVDSTGNTAMEPYLAPLILRVRSTDDGVPRDTTEMRVHSIREDGTVNPAYSGVETYGAYHHFPSGFAADGIDPDGPTGPAVSYGNGISASIALEDFFDFQGGSVTVTDIKISTIPESLLP